MLKSKKLWWALCIGTGLLAAVLLVSHTYNDIVITTRHGINFWNILLDGKLLDFYKVNVLPSGNQFYNAAQAGLHPSLTLMLTNREDYSGEKVVEFEGKDYNVIRVDWTAQRDSISLICEERVHNG